MQNWPLLTQAVQTVLCTCGIVSFQIPVHAASLCSSGGTGTAAAAAAAAGFCYTDRALLRLKDISVVRLQQSDWNGFGTSKAVRRALKRAAGGTLWPLYADVWRLYDWFQQERIKLVNFKLSWAKARRAGPSWAECFIASFDLYTVHPTDVCPLHYRPSCCFYLFITVSHSVAHSSVAR